MKRTLLPQAGGNPIAPADVLRETRAAMALAADPEVGALAQLRDSYQFMIGAVENLVLDASGLSKLEAATDPTPVSDRRTPTLVSTGEAVTS